jgi:hypothetical protein
MGLSSRPLRNVLEVRLVLLLRTSSAALWPVRVFHAFELGAGERPVFLVGLELGSSLFGLFAGDEVGVVLLDELDERVRVLLEPA